MIFSRFPYIHYCFHTSPPIFGTAFQYMDTNSISEEFLHYLPERVSQTINTRYYLYK